MIDIRPDHMEIVKAILKRHVPDAEVLSFASRVTGTAKGNYDLDMVIVAGEPLDFRTKVLLEEAFEESDLPFRVDVVDWATASEEFQEIIGRQYEIVQTVGLKDAGTGCSQS